LGIKGPGGSTEEAVLDRFLTASTTICSARLAAPVILSEAKNLTFGQGYAEILRLPCLSRENPREAKPKGRPADSSESAGLVKMTIRRPWIFAWCSLTIYGHSLVKNLHRVYFSS
ncbi:MAG: hypothetical protein V3U28_08935, partial [Candidatus Acidoferrales bacterium]